jgi:uncharacterized zinc-type alcohol dehydrogenase-like protein
MSFEKVYAIGGKDEKGVLDLVEIPRRPVGDHDVHIKVEFCGICHSDYHTVKGEWGPVKFPCVPGHEVVGIVDKVGSGVTKFKVGDRAGVGCFVDSCRKCDECKRDINQYCSGGMTMTYASDVKDGTSHTYGGYSQTIVVDENYTLHIPSNLDFAATAPLLCAGITTYSPLVHYGVKAGSQLAVLGLGGLGHMAVKFGKAMGAHVTVLSRTPAKNDLAHKLGAEKVLITTDPEAFKVAQRSFDFILDTVSGDHDIDAYLSLLKTDGTLIMVGASPEPLKVAAFSLIPHRVKIAGSMIGGIKETQEMLDFCGKHNIVSDIELVDVSYANKAYERMLKSDVKFRFVLDIAKTLNKDSSIAPPSH